MSAENTTIEDAAFKEAFAAACSECITAARRLKPRLLVQDEGAGIEFGRIAGAAMAKAGATKAEGKHYMQRIMASVLAEPQA
jgi:hypothetical protein